MGKVKKMVYGALFLALGVLLPTIFHMTGIDGKMFLPMHYTVFIAGLFLGWRYGAALGVLTPLLASLLTGMPPLFPVGTLMMIELAVYGSCAGVLYQNQKWNIYIALVAAMILGRLVYGLVYFLLGFAVPNVTFVLPAYLTSVFVTAIPGILLILVLLPPLVKLLQRYGVNRAEVS